MRSVPNLGKAVMTAERQIPSNAEVESGRDILDSYTSDSERRHIDETYAKGA